MCEMKKTSGAYCKKCRYSSHTGWGMYMCMYFDETGQRRNCEIGYCDKFERYKGREKKEWGKR